MPFSNAVHKYSKSNSGKVTGCRSGRLRSNQSRNRKCDMIEKTKFDCEGEESSKCRDRLWKGESADTKGNKVTKAKISTKKQLLTFKMENGGRIREEKSRSRNT